MPDSDKLSDATRRAVLKTVAGAAGIGAAGTASAHEKFQDESEEGPAGTNDPRHPAEGTRGELHNTSFVGYHGIGDVGPATKDERAADYQGKYAKEAEDPHYGSHTEIRTHGDYAYVGMFSSDRPSPGRGMAIIDISDYNAIPADASESQQEALLEAAELNVVSFLRNNNTGVAVMDLKVSDDGQYVFLSTQPYTVLFGTRDGNQQDPTRAEIADPSPNVGDSGFTTSPGGIVAVDVSDKRNPQTLGSFQISGTGSHNAFYHRIDGDDYVFAVHDLNDNTEGMYVLRFDRSTGTLEPVNRWRYERNNAQGEVGTNNAVLPSYIHDVEIQNDPKTGKPVAYLAYWDEFLYALDVSDPANIEVLGFFDMDGCHFTSPAPELINGKRVAVASQEISASDTHSGRIYLVDADGLFEGEPEHEQVPKREDGIVRMSELDMWEWHAEHMYPNEDAIAFGGAESADDAPPFRDFSLSPHNSDFAKHADGSFWVHQSHYNGGVRFLRVDPGTDQFGLTGDDRFECVDGSDQSKEACQGHNLTGKAGPHNSTDWTLEEDAWARPTLGTPQDSRMEGLNYLTPFCWAAVESNGVTFASDINQGVYALKADGVPVGGGPPTADIERAIDGTVFTGGQTNRVQVTMDLGRDLLVRDRLPDGWEAIGGDAYDTVDAGASTFVQFDGEFANDETRNYFASAPESTGTYTFGPSQVSPDGGDTWYTIPDTESTVFVVGQSTAIGAGGVAVGSAGALSKKREAIVDRVADLRSGED